MTQYKITAPVALFSGEVAGVVFSQGQALLTVNQDAERADGATNLPQPNRALAYFERKGYKVEEVKSAEDAKLDSAPVARGTRASRAVDPAGVPGSGMQAPPPAPTPVPSDELAAQAAAAVTADENEGANRPKPPAKSAPKADFVKFATDHGGMTAEDANAMTRDQLAAKYHEEASK